MLPFCPAKAVTIGDNIKRTSNHNHVSDPVRVEVRVRKLGFWRYVHT
jgi:hypothetical protein